MSTIRVVNLQHPDSVEPNVVLKTDGTAVFASGITISGSTNLTVSGTAEFASGTAANPEITFIDDNDTGIYSPAANEVAITTSGTERIRVDDTGKVGIGVGTPSATLQIESSDSKKLLITNTDFDQGTNTGSTFDIGFGATSGNTYTDVRALISGRSTWGDLILQRGGGNVGIGTDIPGSFAGDCELAVNKAGGARIGITGSSRNFFVQGNTSNDQLDFGRRISSNTADDIVFSARADGITFNGDTAAANELSDYEEGTWTPSIVDGITSPSLTTANGLYTKIGRAVYFNFEIRVNSGTPNSNPFTIGGLPYTSANAPQNFASVNINYNNILTGFTELRAGHVSTGKTSMVFYNGIGLINGNSSGVDWVNGRRLIAAGFLMTS